MLIRLLVASRDRVEEKLNILSNLAQPELVANRDRIGLAKRAMNWPVR